MDLFATESDRQRVMKRLGELKAKRASWEPHWRDLSDNMLPRRLRLNPDGEYERGDKQNSAIIDSAPIRAQRRLAAWLMASITSPARAWFRLTTQDPGLSDFGPVKQYLHDVEMVLRWVFSMSNFYQALCDGLYPDLAVFGTAAMILDDDPKHIINCYSMPVGEYYLGSNGTGVIDTCYRDIPMTVRQVVTRFCRDGNLARLSTTTKNSYSRGSYEDVVRVLHVIEPNDDFSDGALGPNGKRWRSWWLERNETDSQKFLLKSGYEEFPVLAPRWSVTGGDVYGRGPGMDALPDCRELQHEAERAGRLLDKSADPPMKGSAGLKSPTLIPGETTILDSAPGSMFEPAQIVNPAASTEVRERMGELRDSIQSIFFADLLLQILSDKRNQRATATEIEEGDQERMLQLGPVLERLNPEVLRPAIDRSYAIGNRLGIFPDPPEELQGQELQIEFISILHQAQKMTGLVAIRTTWQEAAYIAQFKPAVMDKMEADATIDEIADITGLNPKLVLSADGVAKVRAIRAQEERAKAQAEQAAALVQGASTLGKTPAPAPDNALGALMGTMGPVAAAGAPPGGFRQ
jgi:hypothetical protein